MTAFRASSSASGEKSGRNPRSIMARRAMARSRSFAGLGVKLIRSTLSIQGHGEQGIDRWADPASDVLRDRRQAEPVRNSETQVLRRSRRPLGAVGGAFEQIEDYGVLASPSPVILAEFLPCTLTQANAIEIPQVHKSPRSCGVE